MKNIRFYNEDAVYQSDKQHFSSLGGGAVVAYSNDTDAVNYWKPQVIVGTATSKFTTALGGDSYTFTSPNFRVQYTGDTLTNLAWVFVQKDDLILIDKWTVDTSNVTNISYMFFNCVSLISLNLSDWNTSVVTDMRQMFVNCQSLFLINFSNWDTANVTDMSSIFVGCTSLTSLDISSFDFTNVLNIVSMFYGCSSLADLQFGTNLKLSLDLNFCPLTHTSALSVLNGLATITTTQTITFKATTYSTLTAAEIKTATDKGWTITSA